MRIERKRYVVMRKNRTEIWGGLARHYRFRSIEDIGDYPIKTYRTEKQALSSCSSWDRDFEVVPVIETLESTDQPTADVVEVVRCKDCKWWHSGGCAFRKDSTPDLPSADDYCSHGERRERDESIYTLQPK